MEFLKPSSQPHLGSGVREAQLGGTQSHQHNKHVSTLKWQTEASRVSLGYVGKSFYNQGRKSLTLFSFSFARCLENTTNVYSPTSERCSLPGKVCIWPRRTAAKCLGRACPSYRGLHTSETCRAVIKEMLRLDLKELEPDSQNSMKSAQIGGTVNV